MEGFSIGQVVARTGVAEGTLRMWERRHGFPVPRRLPSGHRRYSGEDIELVRRVALERAGGVSLGVAVERARRQFEAPEASLYAAMRKRHPGLEPRTLPKRLLLALTRAIEDESLSRADRPLLFASFQHERYYRQEEPRWRQLSRGAALTVAFADFEQTRVMHGAPMEICVDRSHPLGREWSIVCDAAGHAVCLAAWEPPSSTTGPAGQRYFESIWSVDPAVVRDAARICSGIAAAAHAAVADAVRARLDSVPAPPARAQLRLASAITNRTLSYLAQPGVEAPARRAADDRR